MTSPPRVATASDRQACNAIIGHMTERNITIVTTENIPGDDRPVTGRTLVWAGGNTMAEVLKNIQEWAAENAYDSVVGIRFTVAYRNGISRGLKHFGYGTCLRH
jgi:hypothetical protein